jgi:predicted dehydrogenase
MTEAGAPRRRVLIVGAGRRVQNNFLPALRCLEERFEIRGIHSRTPQRLRSVAGRWGIEAVEDLATVDLSAIDIVAISVPTSQNAVVLRQLLAHAPNLHVVIDTPIAWSAEEKSEIEPLLDAFARVTVTEDYMNFPQFGLVREAARMGLIGRVRSLTLYNIGYLYHGLALIRSFCGFRPVRYSTRQRLGSFGAVVSYHFADEFTATVIGPYRRHTAGGLVLEGTDGIITEFPADGSPGAGDRPVYQLKPVHARDGIETFGIAFPDRELVTAPPHLAAMREMDFEDKSDLNLLRGCGLIDVFLSVAGVHNINRSYGPRNAFYDSFASRRAEQGETALDPFGLLPHEDSNAAEGAGRLSWTASCATFLKGRKEMAGALALDERIQVRPGDTIVARHFAAEGDHYRIGEAELNGHPLPKPGWFIYSSHWIATG